MKRSTQGIVLALLGAVLVRLAVSDIYLRYVTGWMQWPIAVSGVLLMLLGLGPILGSRADPGDGDETHANATGHDGLPRATWLLLLPCLVVFVISPPALGSFLAERRTQAAPAPAPAEFAAVTAGDNVPLEIEEFIWRAQDGGKSLEGRTVTLTGFVSYGSGGRWYVTRMSIACCAADATPYRVQVDAADRPERDTWVQVSGEYVPQSGVDLKESPAITASDVAPTSQPTQTYQ